MSPPRPTSLVLGPHLVSIEFVERIETGRKKRRIVGEAHRLSNRILIVADQAESNIKSTLLHEIDHLGDWMSGMRFVEGWTDELEEASIVHREPYHLDLWTNPANAAVRDYLMGVKR